MSRRNIRAFLSLLVLLLAIGLPGLALAHGGHTGPSQTFTQDLGPYEVAITIEIPSGAPATLYLDVAPQRDMGGTTLRFRAAPRGQSFERAAEAQIQPVAGVVGLLYTELAVDRMGDWELEVRADGPEGSGSARIPFTIEAPATAAGSLGLLVSLGGLVLMMVVSILTSVAAQRRGRPWPGWLNWLIGQAMFACLIAALIFGAQQLSGAIQSASAQSNPAATVALGRPHANMAVSTKPAQPQAGQPSTLQLDLSDGSTGLPVEDLVTHHDALLHLVVISADGGYYAHIHPPRSAPGRFAIEFTPDRTGRYTAYAEIERRDSGTQVIARDFEVAGSGAAPAVPSQGLGARVAGDLDVQVAASGELKAGRQATLTFSFSQRGQPLSDMQPWLGMGGHLIARSADGAIFAHVHAVGPMAPGGVLNTGYSYGPDIQFVYTFPAPGRYQLWGQFRHANQVLTVPLTLDVS